MKYLWLVLLCCKVFSIEHYYCTAADEKFYFLLENLIGSIHCNDKNIKEIAVYDLGLTELQIKKLMRMKCVTVNKLELTNKDLLAPILTSPQGRMVRGCFSWKHVVLKQALEKFPYALYLDAGMSVFGDLEDIFRYIETNGYFFLGFPGKHYIENRITQTVIKEVIDQDFMEYKDLLLQPDTPMQAANVQGVSRKIYQQYIYPLFEYSKRVNIYCDDGTAKLGYGQARHDQTLSSILIHVNKLDMYPFGAIDLKIGEDFIRVYCDEHLHKEGNHIYISQAGAHYNGGFRRYIQRSRR